MLAPGAAAAEALPAAGIHDVDLEAEAVSEQTMK